MEIIIVLVSMVLCLVVFYLIDSIAVQITLVTIIAVGCGGLLKITYESKQTPYMIMKEEITDLSPICTIRIGIQSLSLAATKETTFMVNQPCSDSIRQQFNTIYDYYSKQAATNNK